MYGALVLAAFGSAVNAWSNETIVTDNVTYFTTYCPSPTTFTHGNGTYTVTAATTLTIEDCSCTATPKATAGNSTRSNSTSPVPTQANGGATQGMAAIGAVAAAVAYLL